MNRLDWEGPRELRAQFLLDEDVAFLNHGSFGACPRPVLARQDELRAMMERRPVAFLHRELPGRLAEARAALAGELGCGAGELAYLPNVTSALNAAIRSAPLQPGDEVLCGDHEYGALDRAWEAEALRRGLRIRRVALPLPVRAEGIAAAYEAAAGPAVRALFFSHVCSSSALRLPAAELAALARRRGWLCLVDGAHAPGQVPLEVAALGADVYAGNCHKWLLAPKGCGFVQATAAAQAWLRPTVTSWGYANRPVAERRTPFLDELEWQGTSDPSAWLALPAALDFRRRWEWPARASLCRRRLQDFGDALVARFGLERVTPRDEGLQMLALGLPELDGEELYRRLHEDCGVEVPVTQQDGRVLLRVSLQPYNRESDLERLEAALASLLPELTARPEADRKRA